ncbi:hypothetical protein L1049_026293 [Liquidambar formosana]|uniref:Hydroxyproline-rich glycoprotein family protein n=1 Tax=Liquidambar formosana TaxID=63359 RepID=A0AAP0NF83_LIQFO
MREERIGIKIMVREEGSSRPSIGFPLGLLLLVILLFCMSLFFTCCYHWDKLRVLLRSSPNGTDDVEADTPSSPSDSSPPYMKAKKIQEERFIVLMPGDEVPKFVAMPCPCKSTRMEKIIIQVQK